MTFRHTAFGSGRVPFAAQAVRFCGVGVLSYGIGVTLAATFHEISGLREEIAVGLSLAIVLFTNFALARLYVFRSSGRVHHELARFAVMSAAMRGVDYLLFLALLNGLGIGYLVAMTIAMAVSTSLKFLVYRKVVFREAVTER